MEDEPEKENDSFLRDSDGNPIVMRIPDCCREHWDSCPHVVNRDIYKDKRKNIGL